jgi:hypothetical protein
MKSRTRPLNLVNYQIGFDNYDKITNFKSLTIQNKKNKKEKKVYIVDSDLEGGLQ